jgi:formate dehydrogenase subunit gamma
VPARARRPDLWWKLKAMNAPDATNGPLMATVQDILTAHQGQPGALLPILHELQEAVGYVPQPALPVIAAALNLSRAEVHGVVSYYHHFRSEPAGQCVVQVCRAEACQSRGADALMAHAEKALGCAAHGTSVDGRFTLEPVYCLGLCASSPAIQVADKPHARMTPARFDAVIARQEGAQ